MSRSRTILLSAFAAAGLIGALSPDPFDREKPLPPTRTTKAPPPGDPPSDADTRQVRRAKARALAKGRPR